MATERTAPAVVTARPVLTRVHRDLAASVCKNLCKNDPISVGPSHKERKVGGWAIYPGKLRQIWLAVQSSEIAKTAILSPLRLPFRHIGVGFAGV